MYKNVLVISNRGSIWTKEFVCNVLTKLFSDVFVLYDSLQSDTYDDFYSDNNIKLVGKYKLSPLIMRIPKLRVLYHDIKQRIVARSNKKTYDLIVVLYVTPKSLKLAYSYKKGNTKVCALFIGSDILRVSDKNKKSLISLISKEKPLVVCESKQTSLAYDKAVGSKCNIFSSLIFFGNSAFNFIDEALLLGRDYCKTTFGMPSGKISICVGYNGSPSQQHIRVFESLSKLDRSFKEKLLLIIPAAYGGSNNYKELVKASADTTGIEWLLLDSFLDFENVAKLRVATDIFINSQTTDSISASVMECYYAGSKIINSSNLRYQEFIDWNLDYKSFYSFDDLPNIIVQLLKSFEEMPHLFINKNREKVFDSWSWKACLIEWKKMLEVKI